MKEYYEVAIYLWFLQYKEFKVLLSAELSENRDELTVENGEQTLRDEGESAGEPEGNA